MYNTKQQVKTPTLDAMLAVKDKSQEIGNFIDWLHEENLQICRREDDDELWPINERTESLLARYFEIDLKAAERERCALLAAIRKG